MLRKIGKLRYKLMITVLLLLAVPLAIVAGIAHQRSQTVIRNQSTTLSTRLVQAGAEKLKTSCAQLDDIFRSIYLSDSFRTYLRRQSLDASFAQSVSCADLLKNTFLSGLSSRSDLYSIIYVDSGGRLYYATRGEAGSYSDYHFRGLPEEYEKLAALPPEWTAGLRMIPAEPHMPLRNIRNSEASPVYAAARRIVNTESHFETMGVMFITADMSGMEQLAGMARPDVLSSTYICDGNGRIVFDSTGRVTVGSLPAELFSDLDSEAQHEVTISGQSYVMVSAKAEDIGWYVLTLIPESVYSSDATSVSNAILAAAVIALLAAALVTALISRAISKPAEQLAAAMEDSGVRSLDRRVEVHGSDEIAKLGTSFNTLMDRLETSIQEEYEMELRQKDATIRALQAQMNPHFLYNVLQSISSIASLHGITEIATMSNSLGNILRYNIKGATTLVTVRDEVGHVNDYLAIQQIRFGDRINYSFDIPEYVMCCRLPRVTLQPMAENAIVHGFERQHETGHLSVSGWTEKGSLILEVTDDGRGIPPERLKRIQEQLKNPESPGNAGIGLANLNARLHLFYGERGRLEIESESGVGTVARIILPAERGENV